MKRTEGIREIISWRWRQHKRHDLVTMAVGLLIVSRLISPEWKVSLSAHVCQQHGFLPVYRSRRLCWITTYVSGISASKKMYLQRQPCIEAMLWISRMFSEGMTKAGDRSKQFRFHFPQTIMPYCQGEGSVTMRAARPSTQETKGETIRR